MQTNLPILTMTCQNVIVAFDGFISERLARQATRYKFEAPWMPVEDFTELMDAVFESTSKPADLLARLQDVYDFRLEILHSSDMISTRQDFPPFSKNVDYFEDYWTV